MLTESVRRRLEALNRQPVPALPERAPSRRSKKTIERVIPVAKPAGGYLASAEVASTASGEHLQMRIAVEDLWKGGSKAVSDRYRSTRRTSHNTDERHPELAAFEESFSEHSPFRPRRALFLDLETCGFAGSQVFLIGLLRVINQRLVVELLLARNYAEERAILTSLWRTAANHDVLVTFNGKSFDWPMIHDRSTLHHLGCDQRGVTDRAEESKTVSQAPIENPRQLGRNDRRPELVHFDLVHHARRRWKHALPNCRLQTLERTICGRMREGDIPGSQIPGAYHHYVRTGQTRDVESILHHNALDLVTLLELSMRVAS